MTTWPLRPKTNAFKNQLEKLMKEQLIQAYEK